MLALLKVCTAYASALICLNYVAPNDISPPQPVLADLFELDTTAVHALVSFHSPPTQQFCSLRKGIKKKLFFFRKTPKF